MRRILPLALLGLTLLGGTAMADRGRWRRDHDDRSGVVVRDHRHDTYRDRRDRRVDRVHRGDRFRNRVVIQRRPVYVNNGRYVFAGGVSRAYSRPVIRYQYRDYRYRPQPIVEHYEAAPGYIWVAGHWSWTGYQWSWTPGYYQPDASYQEPYYGDSDYDSGYDGGYYQEPYYQPSISGGVTIQGGIRF